MRKPELLSPAGDWEKLRMAVLYGADAVYLAGTSFGMRSFAGNFSDEELPRAVRFAHEHGVKVHATVNTMPRWDEAEQLPAHLEKLDAAGVDALILADLGAFTLAGKYAPRCQRHISTQQSVANHVCAQAWYDLGASRVVLARELDMDQVMTIHRQIVENDLRGPKGELIQIEMFSHGALCMAVSGKCYLSLHEMNASANRGACYQICRRSYTVKDTESDIELEVDGKYIMSPKDLCTIGFINKMIDAGVRVFKIEGRARSAEYVKTVCECYDEALNAYLDGSYGAEKIANWKERLSTVFNRGFWDGYYLGQRLGEWSEVYGSKATKKKVCIGKVTNYFGKLQVGEFKLESYDLKVGEEVLIVGPNTGVVQMIVPELRLEMEPVEKVDKGAIFSMPCETKLRRSDKLYKLVDTTEELMQ